MDDTDEIVSKKLIKMILLCDYYNKVLILTDA